MERGNVLNEAINEMVQYYSGDEVKLARELRWMGVLLRRADIVPLEDKLMIEKRLSIFDDLMEKDPKMQKIFAEHEARGEAKGEARGEARTLRMVILTVVQQRFPGVVKVAKRRVKQLSASDELCTLFEQINIARNEQEARALLKEPLT